MPEATETVQIEDRHLPEINPPLLDKPVLCLSLDAQPLEPLSIADGISPAEMRLRARLLPTFTPLLLSDQDLGTYAFEDLELVDFYGPFKVYRPKGSNYFLATTYSDREAFRERRQNLLNWCHVPEMDLPLTTGVHIEDQSETLEAWAREYKNRLPAFEAKALRRLLAEVLDAEIITRVKGAPNVAASPKALLGGLEEVVRKLSQPNTHESLHEFVQENLQPLVEFTRNEVERLTQLGNDHSEEVVESLIGLEGYDAVLELIKSQSRLLAEVKKEPTHQGILIPFTKFSGEPSYSPHAKLEIRDKELTITNNGNTFTYPLPQKHEGAQICFKGGLARVVAKIALGEDITSELPIADVDIAVFGNTSLTREVIADTYHTDVRDVEKLGNQTFGEYSATRDSAINEVLVTPDGLFISFNALSSMYQGYTQTADDRTNESLFNKHSFFVYEKDAFTGEKEQVEQFVYVGKERFPSPVVLSRMFKLLIDDKCEGVVVPQGIRKTDIGVYWLVMTRKILAETDPAVRDAKMERMLALAKFVESPYYQDLPDVDKDSPDAFVVRLKAAFPDFDMTGNLSKKDTVVWITHKLRNQILRAFMNSVGHSQERDVQKKLEAADMDLEVLTLPPMEAYGVAVQKREMKLQEKRKLQKIREVIGVFDQFSIEPNQQMKNTEEEIRSYLGDIYSNTSLRPGELGRMYYIPAHKKLEFQEALKATGYIFGPDASGVSFAVYDSKISAVFVGENEQPMETRMHLFEELYHASGFKIAGKRAARVGYSVTQFTNDGKLPPTTLLEEGVVGLEWKLYKDRQIAKETEVGKQLRNAMRAAQRTHIVSSYGMIETFREDVHELSADFVTFIQNVDGELRYYFSPSSVAGEVLDTIVARCGGESMLKLLRQARRGDVTVMREVAKRIDQTFGRKSYSRLLKTSANDLLAIEDLKNVFKKEKTQI